MPVYALSSILLGGLPIVSIAAGVAQRQMCIRDSDTPTVSDAVVHSLAMLPVAALLTMFVFALLTLMAVRLLAIGLSLIHISEP
ncbi:hypothetical protein, partial [Rhodococcus rhodochrous]|uniref:hypothetical protein n=1 Tax=Rhodococcus rhodochrous TaxID=1829 RepID=UPI001E6041E6